MANFAVIIPAAGQSQRFGGQEKKPFVSLDGRPIWQRSAELFWSRDDVVKVYLVLAAADREDFRTRFGHLIAFANIQLVDGGVERFESVANALVQVPQSVEYVAVHDAVRPLATPALIDAIFSAALTHGAVMPAVAVVDTLKRADPATHQITETVNRAHLWQAQTPQVFRRDWLVEGYARRSELTTPITDDAQLLSAIGHAVHVVPGGVTNFKITTKDDLELAEAVLAGRGTKASSRPALSFNDEAQW